MKDFIDSFPILYKQNIAKLYLNTLILPGQENHFYPPIVNNYMGGEPCNVATLLTALSIRRDPTWLGGKFTAWQQAAELIKQS